MLQWREKAVEPKGDQTSELWFFYHLGRMLRERLRDSTDPRDRPLLDLNWGYDVHEGGHGLGEPSADSVLRAINGYDTATGRVLDSYMQLKDDGSTASGCWIYSGVYAGGVNQAARRTPRDPDDPTSPALEWGWA